MSHTTSSSETSSCSSSQQSIFDHVGRPTTRSSILDDYELPLVEFDRTFFSSDAEKFEPIVPRFEEQYAAFSKCIVDESCDAVTHTQRLLNDLCRMYEELNDIPRAQCIKFVNHSHAPLLYHPRKSVAMQPQLVAVSAPVSESWECDPTSAISWHHVTTTVHVRVDMQDEEPVTDCTRSLRALNQARPDLAGCLSLAVSRWNLRFLWSDPSTLCPSQATLWSRAPTLLFIMGFIHRIHWPFARDTTVSLDAQLSKEHRHDARPIWCIQDDDGGVYRTDTVISVGEPQSRQNWVVAASEYRAPGEVEFKPCQRTIVKDSWPRVKDEPTWEGHILRHIHSNCDFPGVGHVLSAYQVPIVTAPSEVSAPVVLGRHKHRVILDGTSQDLQSCVSVVDFFMVMYDVLEVLKQLNNTRGVMHRDISMSNILRRPESHSSAGSTPMKFAGDILSYKYSNIQAGTRCTLIDFDNAFWRDHAPNSHLEFAVGTPSYVARAVTSSFSVLPTIVPPPVAALTGSARECFVGVCGDQPEDDIPAGYTPADISEMEDICKDRAHASPHHDAESCFWVILRFLVTAFPIGCNINTPLSREADQVLFFLETGSLDCSTDCRSSIFTIRRSHWHQALRGDLKQFGPFLHTLGQAVCPIYEYLEPPLPPYHLHTVMQRILLQEICRVLDSGTDVPLIPLVREATQHPPTVLPALKPSTRGSRKRRGDELDCPVNARRRRLS